MELEFKNKILHDTIYNLNEMYNDGFRYINKKITVEQSKKELKKLKKCNEPED